jgi:hypothetical protein
MPDDQNIDKALKHLEEGKFSFQMVDCINQCIQTQKAELSELRAFETAAVADLARDQLTIARLERELKSANARIFALIKTNALLEQGIASTKSGIAAFGDVVVPKMQQTAEDARPHVLKAAKYLWAALLRAYGTAAPVAWTSWLEIERRLKEVMKSASQSSAGGRH